MPKAKVKSSIAVGTVERAAAEMIDEVYRPWDQQINKLHRAKTGSAAQREAIVKLCTLSNIAEIKGRVMTELLEEYLEANPDN